MLVTFRTESFADTTMFGDVAVALLNLMGHSGNVPGALMPEDIPAALKRLNQGLATAADSMGATDNAAAEDEDSSPDSDEPPVSLGNRALPLIQLLEAAHRDNVPVMWDK